MSAMSFARQAFGLEKPHSSITDWVDILCGPGIAAEAYDGIPELVDSINLQPAVGPGEASRALRKKLKHGNSHQQYRALVLLKALVENCGDKFKTSFADGHLTDAIKYLALNSDGHVDKRVQKKTMLVLASWNQQFKGDPSMSVVTSLYTQCKRDNPHRLESRDAGADFKESQAEINRRAEKEEVKKRAKKEKEEAKERQRREEEERRKKKNRPRRAPFDFEKEKPKVLSSIVDASQTSSNLVNAIRLVNRQTDTLQSNERVQECLAKTKQARKIIVRYIQLVENEELIGTLIETNDRVISALEMYDQLLAADGPALQDGAIASGLAATHISLPESEVTRLQEKQRAAVERAKHNDSLRGGNDSNLHPDLEDLNFGSIGTSNNLPPPLRPTSMSDDDNDTNDRRGSLSDFSDYESSDEDTHKARGKQDYYSVSANNSEDDVGAVIRGGGSSKKENLVDDPFADPFADEVAVGPSKKW